MSDDYEFVSRGSLKLKSSGLGVSKKSKKSKKKDKLKQSEIQQEVIEKVLEESSKDSSGEDSNSSKPTTTENKNKSWMTAAERKFLQQQEKRQLTRVMDKAIKSHKQRVEEFNTHLENLSEHYDIPKVSWTK